MATEDTKATTQLYKKQLADLKHASRFSLRVSKITAGEEAGFGLWLGSRVHSKLCVHGASLVELNQSSLFDHSGMMALARMILEGMILYFYLVETISDDETQCRYLTLCLHDVTGRLKFIRLGQRELYGYEELKAKKKEYIEDLSKNPFFCSLAETERQAILTGERYFIGGLHNIAARAAGWSKDNFLGLYSYLSAHVHSAPVSFFRYAAHAVNFVEPSPAQLAAVSHAMCIAECGLVRTSIHMLESSRRAVGMFSSKEVSFFKEQAIAWQQQFATPLDDQVVPG